MDKTKQKDAFTDLMRDAQQQTPKKEQTQQVTTAGGMVVTLGFE